MQRLAFVLLSGLIFCACGEPNGATLNYDDLVAGDVDAGDVSAGSVQAGDVDAGDVSAGDVMAGTVQAGDVQAGDVYAGDVSAGDVTIYGLGVVLDDINLSWIDFSFTPNDDLPAVTGICANGIMRQITPVAHPTNGSVGFLVVVECP